MPRNDYNIGSGEMGKGPEVRVIDKDGVVWTAVPHHEFQIAIRYTNNSGETRTRDQIETKE